MAGRNSWLKMVLAIGLAVFSIGFLAAQYFNVRDRSKTNEATTVVKAPDGSDVRIPAAQNEGPPSREEIRQVRDQMLGALDLTPEQRDQIAALDKQFERSEGAENWRERRAAMAEILTPEQHQQMRSQMRAMRDARMNERLQVLPPDQQQKFREKMEERRREGRNRGPGGGGPAGPEQNSDNGGDS